MPFHGPHLPPAHRMARTNPSLPIPATTVSPLSQRTEQSAEVFVPPRSFKSGSFGFPSAADIAVRLVYIARSRSIGPLMSYWCSVHVFHGPGTRGLPALDDGSAIHSGYLPRRLVFPASAKDKKV